MDTWGCLLTLDGVQRQVQFQHIDSAIAQESELRPLGLPAHQGLDLSLAEPPGLGHPVNLVAGGLEADVRIQAAARGGDQVHGDWAPLLRIGRLQGYDPRLHCLPQVRVARGQVGTTTVGPIVGQGLGVRACGGGGAAPEVSWVGEVLPDKHGSYHPPVFADKAARGLIREGDPRQTAEDERVRDSGEDRKGQERNDRGPDLRIQGNASGKVGHSEAAIRFLAGGGVEALVNEGDSGFFPLDAGECHPGYRKILRFNCSPIRFRTEFSV